MVGTESLSVITNPFLTNVILPFLLVFVVLFAILEKVEILGKEKKNTNIIVALVIALLFVGVQKAVGFTVAIIPLIAVLIMILLCFYLIFGFVGIHEARGIKIMLGIIFGIAFIVIILWAAQCGQQTCLQRMFGSAIKSNTIAIITLVAVLGGAIALVVAVPKRSS